MALEALKYLLSGPQWTKFADPSSSILERGPKGRRHAHLTYKLGTEIRAQTQDSLIHFCASYIIPLRFIKHLLYSRL